MEDTDASRKATGVLPAQSSHSAAGSSGAGEDDIAGIASSNSGVVGGEAGSSRVGDDGGAVSSSSGVPGSEILRAEEAVADVEATARYAESGAVFGITGERVEGGPSSRDILSTFKLGDAVEEDARAVARSLTYLLGSLKSSLSEVTGSSLEHMRVENEAAGQVQDAAIDAATRGNRFINACLRLNEEMKGMGQVAAQLESLKHRVDQFEQQSNRYLLR